MSYTLAVGDHIDLILDGMTIRVTHVVETGAGDVSAIQLSGIDCNLQGEEPGLYYLDPLPLCRVCDAPMQPTADGLCPECAANAEAHDEALAIAEMRCEQCGVLHRDHPAGDGLDFCPGDFGAA